MTLKKRIIHLDKAWVISELKVIFALFLTFFAVDAATDLMKLYNGNFEAQVFFDLAKITGQSFMRAILTLAFPSVFSHNSSKIASKSK